MTLPDLCFISQDGSAPSGISSYGFQVLRAFPDAQMLLLNATKPPPAAPPDVVNRIRAVPEAESHDARAVARHLRALIEPATNPVVVFPNTGDTPWSATVHCLGEVAPDVRSRVRVLGIVHSDVETQYAGAVRYATFASVWMGVSRRCTEVLQARLAPFGLPAVHCLPYPMPAALVAADRPAGGPLRLVYVGRLEEQQKRVSRLAAVFTAMAQRDLSFQATIVGDGPARADLIAAVRASPAAANVVFTGALGADGIASVLQRSDVFLLTSAFEGLPLALLEAMAAGVSPVVMQIDSGLEDAVTAGENAIVVPQGDVPAMVAAIEDLDRDREHLASLRRAARERIRSAFSPEKHFERLTTIIKECFRRPRPDPDCVPPDPTALAVARLVQQARSATGVVAIYGAGMFGRKVVDACMDAAIPVSAWFDSDPARCGLVYRALVCLGPSEIPEHAGATFLVGSLEFADEIAERILAATRAAGAAIPRIVTAVESP